jgi:curli biogenesis system outer membrane secretion channel CsgG
MKSSSLHKALTVALFPLVLAACSTMQMGGVHTVASGSAAGANAQGANTQLQHCTAPLGTVALDEHTHDPWYYALTSQYHLPSTIPVMRLIIQQSNCFMVVDRGVGLDASMQERALQESGELRSGSQFHKGQLVAADYTLVPSVTFSDSNAGGAAVGAVLGLFSPIAGALAGGMHTKTAGAMLIMDDNRSGVQVVAATGSAESEDFGGLGGLAGGAGAGAIGAYSNTPQGKVVVASFVDAYNNLVKAVRDYKAQHIAGGPGTGGSLHVQP